MVDLPYGRGARTGPDGFVGQTESYALRGQAITPIAPGVLSTSRTLVHSHSHVSSNVAAGYVFFVPLAPESTDVVVSEVRLNVSTGAANSTMSFALYVLERSTLAQIRKIAPTEVTFNTTAVGRLTLELPERVTLPANQLLFVGMVQANNPNVGCVNAFNASTQLFLVRYIAATTLPQTATVSDLLTTTLQQIPLIAYLSPDLAEVL